MLRDDGSRMARHGDMRPWRIGVALAAGLLAWGFMSSNEVRADHLSPKHDPWAQPWELERLAY